MNSPPGNFFRLSTDQFAERDRIEAACELIGRSLMKMEFDLLPDVPFNIKMVFRVLPDFGLASGTCSAMDCLRTAQMIESDDLILTVALSGGSALHVRDSEIPIGGGMAALTGTTDVSRCAIHSTSEFVNFRFPFEKIAPMIADLDAAAMRPIPVNTEALRLLVHYASALKNEAMLATPQLQSLISSHLQDLAVLVIGATRDAEMIAGSRGIPAARLRAIKADIVRNFADRDLSIDAVAQRNGISPRYVSMLLESVFRIRAGPAAASGASDADRPTMVEPNREFGCVRCGFWRPVLFQSGLPPALWRDTLRRPQQGARRAVALRLGTSNGGRASSACSQARHVRRTACSMQKTTQCCNRATASSFRL